MSKACAIYAWPIRLSSPEGAEFSASHFGNCCSEMLAITRGISYCDGITPQLVASSSSEKRIA